MCTPGTNCTDGVAYDGGTAGSSLVWGGSSTTKVYRNVAAASYDFGPLAVNDIYAKAYTFTKAGSLSAASIGLQYKF